MDKFSENCHAHKAFRRISVKTWWFNCLKKLESYFFYSSVKFPVIVIITNFIFPKSATRICRAASLFIFFSIN